MHLISRVGLISKGCLNGYYNLRVYISHKRVHFTYTNTYLVFLRVTNSTEITNTCSSIAVVQNRLTWKTWNLSSSFFPSCKIFYYLITPSCDGCKSASRTKTLCLLAFSTPSDWDSYRLQFTGKRLLTTSHALLDAI